MKKYNTLEHIQEAPLKIVAVAPNGVEILQGWYHSEIGFNKKGRMIIAPHSCMYWTYRDETMSWGRHIFSSLNDAVANALGTQVWEEYCRYFREHGVNKEVYNV